MYLVLISRKLEQVLSSLMQINRDISNYDKILDRVLVSIIDQTRYRSIAKSSSSSKIEQAYEKKIYSRF